MNCSSFILKIMKFTEQDYIVKQNFDISSLDYKKIKLHIIGYENFANLTKNCFFIFDYYKHNYLCIKSFNEYFNEIPEKINEPYLFFNNKIHPDDLDFVYQIHLRTFRYVFSLAQNERKGLQMYYNCRYQNKFNEYEMTNINIKLLDTDSIGNIWLVLFVIEMSDSENYKIPYIETETGDIRQFTLNQTLLKKLTDAEKEIVFMMFGNISNKEIAQLMHKSFNTIRANIQNIYFKLEVTNRFEFQKKLLTQCVNPV